MNLIRERPPSLPSRRSRCLVVLLSIGISGLWLLGCGTPGELAGARDPSPAPAAADADSTPPSSERRGADVVIGQAEGQAEGRTAEEAEARRGGDGGTEAEGSGGDSEDETSAGDETEAQPEEEPGQPGRVVLKTVYDDRRVGSEQEAVIAAELGLYEDEKLESYLRSVAVRLLRHTQSRPFDYEFRIVDQAAPNALALPGGKIYVSRGLLALASSEDELAAVLGHEITHASERHAAGRIEHSRRLNPFAIGYRRAAAIAAYGREQERDADRGGQILAAKAGYDPGGIATFMRKLDAYDRYEIGWSRLPNFLATHPTSPERSALAANRAASLEWKRARPVADSERFGYHSMIDGLVLGENPAGGVFEETRFVHPELRFSIRFPRGWSTINSPQAVIAISPGRDAQASLTVEGEAGDLDRVVDEFLEKETDGIEVKVQSRQSVQIGGLTGIRIEGRASGGGAGLWTQMVFVEYGGLVYRLSILSLSGRASAYRGRAHLFAHSFRPLDELGARSLRVTRLRTARALENETLEQLSARTRNALELVYTGVLNDLFASTSLPAGRLVKIGLQEPYFPMTPEPSAQGDGESKSGEPTLETGQPRLEPEPGNEGASGR